MNDHMNITMTSVQNEACTLVWTVVGNSYLFGTWHVEIYRYQVESGVPEDGLGLCWTSETCDTTKVARLIKFALQGCGTSTPTRRMNKLIRDCEAAMFKHEAAQRGGVRRAA